MYILREYYTIFSTYKSDFESLLPSLLLFFHIDVLDSESVWFRTISLGYNLSIYYIKCTVYAIRIKAFVINSKFQKDQFNFSFEINQTFSSKITVLYNMFRYIYVYIILYRVSCCYNNRSIKTWDKSLTHSSMWWVDLPSPVEKYW